MPSVMNAGSLDSVLFLTTDGEDYLQDQVLTGLRQHSDVTCIDAPRKSVLYTDCTIPDIELYGNGFTIWKRLDPVDYDRGSPIPRAVAGEFDAVVFGSIHRQKNLYRRAADEGLFKTDVPVAFLDGEDFLPNEYLKLQLMLSTRGHSLTILDFVHQNRDVLFNKALHNGVYFKRELTSEIYREAGVNTLISTSFSIPRAHIRNTAPEKEQRYMTHVQCDEARKIPEINKNSTKKYAFTSEREYFDDIAAAKYGITMKKGGWDCMRHYEIAANYTIPCFYQLDDKPNRCAPHGLQDLNNCITFDSASELQEKVELVESKGWYDNIASSAHAWATENTCRKRAASIIKYLSSY